MNKPKTSKLLKAITILLLATISSCNSTQPPSNTNLNPSPRPTIDSPSTLPSQSPERYSPSPIPSQSPELKVSCPIDTSEIISTMSNLPSDPVRANSMIFTIENAKQILTRISVDNSCAAEKERLAQSLQAYWQYYITLDYQKDVLLAGVNQSACKSGCNLASDDSSDSCEIGCKKTYQGALEEAQADQESKVKEMKGFFASIR